MGEEQTISKCQFFFCRSEDLDTGNESWEPISVDNVKIHLPTEEKEAEVKESWSAGFSFTATVEDTSGLSQLASALLRHRQRRFHYIRKRFPKEFRKSLRKQYIQYKKMKFKKKQP